MTYFSFDPAILCPWISSQQFGLWCCSSSSKGCCTSPSWRRWRWWCRSLWIWWRRRCWSRKNQGKIIDSRTVVKYYFRPNALLPTMNVKPQKKPKRVSSSPSQTSSWMSNHGMMKLIWALSKPKFVKSKPMVSSGELPNSSQSATASRNFKSVVSLKTIKLELTSSKKKFAPLKITWVFHCPIRIQILFFRSNPSMLPLSTKSNLLTSSLLRLFAATIIF